MTPTVLLTPSTSTKRRDNSLQTSIPERVPQSITRHPLGRTTGCTRRIPLGSVRLLQSESVQYALSGSGVLGEVHVGDTQVESVDQPCMPCEVCAVAEHLLPLGKHSCLVADARLGSLSWPLLTQ